MVHRTCGAYQCQVTQGVEVTKLNPTGTKQVYIEFPLCPAHKSLLVAILNIVAGVTYNQGG